MNKSVEKLIAGLAEDLAVSNDPDDREAAAYLFMVAGLYFAQASSPSVNGREDRQGRTSAHAR